MGIFGDVSNRLWWDSKSASEKEDVFDSIEQSFSEDELIVAWVQEYRSLSDTGVKLSEKALRFLRKYWSDA